MTRITRRSFLGRSAAVAAPMIVPASVFGRQDKPAPSNRVGVGFIGVGTMNYGHVKRCLGMAETQVVAVCDVDKDRREFNKRAADMHYSKQAGSTYKGCDTYNDYKELIARKDIDAVVIATPDHWHAIVALDAMKAGKDVYCEKPLTLTIHEAKTLIEAARKLGRVFQTGSQQRSDWEFQVAVNLVRKGAIGKLKQIIVDVGSSSKPCDLPEQEMQPGLDWDRWLGPAPKRPYHSDLSPRGVHTHFPSWRNWKEYSGGMMTDWGAHHFDIAQWMLAADESGPVEIIPPADGKDRGVKYVYANGVEVIHASSGGVRAIGSDGELLVNRGKLDSNPKSIVAKYVDDQGKLKMPAATDEFFTAKPVGHMRNFLECMKSRAKPICDVEVGARSVTVCHLGNHAYWNKQALKWDPKAWTFVDGKGDAKWLDRDRREGYGLPTL